MKTHDLHLFLNLRRALYILTFVGFAFFVVVFYLAVKSKDNPIGAEIKVSDTNPKLLPDQVDDKQVLFTLSNGSNFDWSDVRLTVNDKYVVEPGPLVAGESRAIRIGDLKNIHTIPQSLIPTNRLISAHQAIDPQETHVTQDLYAGLLPLQMIRVRTSGGRIMYEPEKGVYYRMGTNNKPTTFLNDLRRAF